MASIQILELHPVECQIEQLSYEAAASITGGGLLSDLAECYAELVEDLADAIEILSFDRRVEAVQEAFGDLAQCVRRAIF